MKKTTRLICYVLCVIMLSLVFTSCKAGVSDKDTSPVPGNITSNTSPDEYISSYEPSGNKYNGADFIILLSGKSSNVSNFYEYAEENPTVIDIAVQQKNAAVAQDYDVSFKVIKDMGGKNTAAQKMSQAINSESMEYHASFIESYSVVTLAVQDVLFDLNKLPGLNLKNEWWDQNANEDLSVNGLLYFTIGDIDAWDDMQQFIMIFNSSMFERDVKDCTVDELYQASKDGKWTYDMFYKLAKGYTKDIDGTDGMTKDDQWGMITWDDTIYAVFASSGGQVIADVDGELTLPIFANQTAQDCMREYTEWTENNGYNYSQRDNSNGSNAIKMFTNNKALFFLARLQTLNNFRDMESDFGLVPIPKYTEDQEYAITCSPYHLNLLCTINLDVSTTMRGEILESLAYYSRQYLTPAYREKTLEGQSARDDGSLQTLEISAGNRIYDLGFYLRPGNITSELIYLYREWSTDYASMYARVRETAENKVEEVADAYKSLANS